MSDHAIEIRGLQKTYASGGKQALKGVDLNIPRGRIFGLLGPNGAGKSTMINILAGLVTKTAGQVTIWGFDQDVNPRQSRAAIGVMPQELNLDPFLTPRESLEVQAGLYGISRAKRRTDEILEMIDLTDKAHAYSRTLSGGMRRRLLLGKALVHDPQILVLDEPTAGVDIALRQMLWENVRRLNKAGKTIILTTHYLEEAQEMCDDIAIIDQGQLKVQDSTKNLLARLDQKSLRVVGDVDMGALNLPDHMRVREDDQGGVVFTYPQSKISAGQILEILHRANAVIQDIKTQEADLEDVFLSLTSRPDG